MGPYGVSRELLRDPLGRPWAPMGGPWALLVVRFSVSRLGLPVSSHDVSHGVQWGFRRAPRVSRPSSMTISLMIAYGPPMGLPWAPTGLTGSPIGLTWGLPWGSMGLSWDSRGIPQNFFREKGNVMYITLEHRPEHSASKACAVAYIINHYPGRFQSEWKVRLQLCG